MHTLIIILITRPFLPTVINILCCVTMSKLRLSLRMDTNSNLNDKPSEFNLKALSPEELHEQFRALTSLISLLKYLKGDKPVPKAKGFTKALDPTPEGVLIAAANLLVRDHETVATALVFDPLSRQAAGVVATTDAASTDAASNQDSNGESTFVKWVKGVKGIVIEANVKSSRSKDQASCELVPKGSSHWGELEKSSWFGLRLL
jgi:hypothetical protein